MEDPRDLLKQVSISEEDKSNVDNIASKYPEIAGLQHPFHELFPEHDKVLIEALMIDNPDHLLFEHHILLSGLIARSYGLLSAATREIIREDMAAVVTLLRAQCETLGAACYVEEFPEKFRSILYGNRTDGSKEKAPNVLTQMKHANKKYQGLLDDYNQLSELAHPNAMSHFAPITIVDEEKKVVEFSSGGQFKTEDAVVMVKQLFFWTKWFLETARSIHEKFVRGDFGGDSSSS